MEGNNVEFTLDTDYAPKFSNEDLGEIEKEFNFMIVKFNNSNDTNITIIKETDENVKKIEEMMMQGYKIMVLGMGTAKNTNVTELMYGLNHPTRTLFRSGVNDLVKAFTEGDDLLRKSLKEG